MFRFFEDVVGVVLDSGLNVIITMTVDLLILDLRVLSKLINQIPVDYDFTIEFISNNLIETVCNEKYIYVEYYKC